MMGRREAAHHHNKLTLYYLNLTIDYTFDAKSIYCVKYLRALFSESILF